MKWKRGASTKDVIDVRGGSGGSSRRGGAALPIGGGAGRARHHRRARGRAARRRWRVGLPDPRGLRRGHAGADAASRSRPARTRTPSSRTSPPTSSTTCRAPGQRTFEAAGRPYERAKVVFYNGARRHGVRQRVLRGRPVLLPGRPLRVPRPVVLRRHGAAARRAGRLRLGLRDRPRGRPPRPAAARHQRRGRPASAAAIPDKANDASVRLELQADCYAGVWARGVFDQLEPGDLDEALTASEAVGRRPAAAAGRPAASTRTRSRTAPPSSAAAGSSAAAREASRPTATRSRPRTCSRRYERRSTMPNVRAPGARGRAARASGRRGRRRCSRAPPSVRLTTDSVVTCALDRAPRSSATFADAALPGRC